MGKINSVLFVCTGNSCRSVMAEWLLKKYLKSLGKSRIKVQSAGILALGGLSPTSETIDVMSHEGLDVKGYISKSLTTELLKDADLILVMEDLHKKEVLKILPEAASKTYLLREFGKETEEGDSSPSGISDPIGRSIDVYKNCLETIKKEIERIAKVI